MQLHDLNDVNLADRGSRPLCWSLSGDEHDVSPMFELKTALMLVKGRLP